MTDDKKGKKPKKTRKSAPVIGVDGANSESSTAIASGGADAADARDSAPAIATPVIATNAGDARETAPVLAAEAPPPTGGLTSSWDVPELPDDLKAAASAAKLDDKPDGPASAANPVDVVANPANLVAKAEPPKGGMTSSWDVPEVPAELLDAAKRAAETTTAKPGAQPAAKPDDPLAAKPDATSTGASLDAPLIPPPPGDKPAAANHDNKPSGPPQLIPPLPRIPSSKSSPPPIATSAINSPLASIAVNAPLASTAVNAPLATAAPLSSESPTAASRTSAPMTPSTTTSSDSSTPTPSAGDERVQTKPYDKPLIDALTENKYADPMKAADTTNPPASTASATAVPTASASLSGNDLAAVAIEETSTADIKLAADDDELVDWNPEDYAGAHSPDFMLADEDVTMRPPAPEPEYTNAPPALVSAPLILQSPQEAALEAARIVSQMVDIDSESGAMIAAAAAAGAAIEAAVAAQKAAAAASATLAAHANSAGGVSDPANSASAATAGGEPSSRASQPVMRVGDIHAASVAGATHDPVTTVRLSRDRILAALANEEANGPSARDSQMRLAAGDPNRMRARTEPGIPDEAYEEFDPVAIAAAAIGRLRQRARTDLAELRVHYHRHDILVVLMAFLIIVGAGRVHANLTTPANEAFSERGLTFDRPSTFLRPEPLPLIAPRIVRDLTGAAKVKDENLYFVELTAPGSTARLEVLIDKKPAWSNIVTGLELDRRSRWGELYRLDASSVQSVAGHDWLRTAYRYAHVPEKNDDPRVDRAIEYATIDRDQIYVITLYGTAAELAQLEDVVPQTLRVPTQTGLPLVPQTGRLSQRKYPRGVGRAFDSTVMVVVADLVDGRLRARGGGSGVIVGAEGSILTNYHVLHDKDGRLHDTFIIGRFSSPDHAPQLHCAGRPNRSKLLRDLDLALIKCDMDLDGRTWSPATSGIWPTLLESRAVDIKMGQRLFVLGYPDVGGGGMTMSTGEVEGWTGEDGAQGKDFIKTDASITHGNSGGPVIDEQGKLVGIAAAFRTRVTAAGGVIETSQVGLVRPLGAASNLLAYAAAGWTPREGYTDVELTPSAVEAAAEGVRIFTTVIDDASEAPVRDATVMVLKSGVDVRAIDMNRLDDQAIAWGKTNAFGEVRLKHLVPVPGTYTVMVVAPGYEPLIGPNELHLDDKTPSSFDPWDRIGLRSR